MTDVAPRCPFCANVIKVQPTFWSRLGIKPARAVCPNCQRVCEARDAQTMGASYFHWAERFRGQFTDALRRTPVLSEPAMVRTLGNPHKDDTRLITSIEELVRACLRHQRQPVIEMARGRAASLEVVALEGEKASEKVVAILGTSSTESGAKEFEQLVARTGESQFVLYTYPGSNGAEPRVRRAIHALTDGSRISTEPRSVDAFQASRAPASAPQQARRG